MHRKSSIPHDVSLTEVFLETSEADLLGRWRKELRSFMKKDRPSRGVVAEKSFRRDLLFRE